MKKLWLLSIVLLTGVSLFANPGNRNKIPLLEDTVTRKAAQQTTAELPWHNQLKQVQAQWNKLGRQTPMYDPLPVMVHTPLSHQDEPAYLRRFVQVQQSIAVNKLLAGYKFVAPVPTDLATLSLDNYAALHAFLKDLKTAQVTQLKRVRPFTLSVQIKGVPQGALELWIDVPSKKVYLMSNNVYTTADGKYGLHLK